LNQTVDDGVRNDEEKQAQSKEMRKHASGFKTKIKKATARVDCWNRSVSNVKGTQTRVDDAPTVVASVEMTPH
jgi:hypothetical protein